MSMLKKPIIRDRKYLNELRDMPCILSGRRGNDYEAVDPAHIGTMGKGIKSPDNEALPIMHCFHVQMHQQGEVSFLREHAPDDVLRAAFRALAREKYEEWKNGY